MIAISGLLASSIYVGSPAQLASSLYGRTLVLKLACVAGAAICGALNWRDLHRAPTASPATVIRRVTVELAFGTAAVAVTGALAELPHP
jgi:putative copper export protein